MTDTTIHLDRLPESYAQHLDAMKALQPAEVLKVNVDLDAAAMNILGIAQRLKALRDGLLRMPDTPKGSVDGLESLARAALHAHGNYRAAITPPESMSDLVERGTALRDLLTKNGLSLADYKLLDGKELSEMTGGPGHKKLASDLIALAAIFTAAWSRIEGKTPVSREDLRVASALGDSLLTGLGVRVHHDEVVAEATDLRARAFTLLFRAYDDVRQAIGYVRWKTQDADDFAPSIYSSSKRAPKRDEEPEKEGTPTKPTSADIGSAAQDEPAPESDSPFLK